VNTYAMNRYETELTIAGVRHRAFLARCLRFARLDLETNHFANRGSGLDPREG
jgi:hypothetical protein